MNAFAQSYAIAIMRALQMTAMNRTSKSRKTAVTMDVEGRSN
jgi:hypothetical protein